MKQERMNNGYIFRYAAILVIIVAALLSLAAVVLAPYQQRNKDNEKRKNILRAAGIADLTDSNVQQLFTKLMTFFTHNFIARSALQGVFQQLEYKTQRDRSCEK